MATNYCWQGRHVRLSLDRALGKHVESKTEAEGEAEKIRLAIRGGRWSPLATSWRRSYGHQLASAKLDEYRLATICSFRIPEADSRMMLGDRGAGDVSLLDVEAFREHRRQTCRLSAVAVNHDLRLMRKIFNWALRKGLVSRTPFKNGSEPVIQLERETPQHWRFQSDEEEQRLLDAANPHLGGLIVAMLETRAT